MTLVVDLHFSDTCECFGGHEDVTYCITCGWDGVWWSDGV